MELNQTQGSLDNRSRMKEGVRARRIKAHSKKKSELRRAHWQREYKSFKSSRCRSVIVGVTHSDHVEGLEHTD